MSVNTEAQKRRRSLEIVKWIVVTVILLVAIVGNYFYHDRMILLRTFALIILIAVASGVALSTEKGKAAVAFVREARAEVRKVIWPTREETFHTTLIIVGITVVMSLILWGLDSMLVRLVSFIITSLRF